MNKTVTINISGIIFHIDDNAYEQLNNYLNTIRGYFKNTEGGDEIMSDIESRIAEMFQQKVGDIKQAILLKDVEEMISIMGKPESFILEDDIPGNKTEYTEQKFSTGSASNKNRRVFRDGDDKVLGGVCSGIANYFNLDPLWIRIAFAIAFFGFGTGFFIYILLWIIVPEAKTTAEKLEMRGENINISSIEKTIKEELDDLKRRYNTDGQAGTKVKDGLQRFVNFIIMIITFLAKALLKILGGFLIFIGVVFLIALTGMFFGSDAIISITSKGVSEISLPFLLNTFFNSQADIAQAKIGLGLLVIIPVLMVIYSGIKIVFKINQKNRLLKGIALGLWTVGLVLSIMTVYRVSKEFGQKSVVKSYVDLPVKSDIVTLSSTALQEKLEEQEEMEDNGIKLGDWNIISQNDERLNFGYPRIDIIKSETDSFELVIQRSARAKTKKEATSRAEEINYLFNATDSTIQFSPDFSIAANQKWRDQSLKVILKVPVGKTIFIDKTLKRSIYDIDNVSNTLDHEMLGRRWLMTEQGLKCIDCKGIVNEDEKEEEGDVPPPPPAPGHRMKATHRY